MPKAHPYNHRSPIVDQAIERREAPLVYTSRSDTQRCDVQHTVPEVLEERLHHDPHETQASQSGYAGGRREHGVVEHTVPSRG